ncbi:MAG: trigger factor [Deltaproteobacteria bacterium]|nr:trigger factor [Deltaproteobacteria bacterium]
MERVREEMQTTELKIAVEELSPVKKRLDITVPAEAVKREIDSAYKSLRSSVNIAGFRKGAVPMNILKARFSGHVQEDVVKKLIENAYPHALSEKAIQPVDAPKVEIKTETLEEGKEFAFSAVVEVSPALEIDGYKGMKLEKKPIEVTDKDVEEGMQKLREVKADFKDVDRPAKDGDLVVVDFEGFMNNEPVKNTKSVDYPVLLGEKTLLPGFDEALRGASKGDNRDANVSFPPNYSEKTLAGQEAQFKLTIKAVKEKGLPEISEEFAKSVGCENIEALNAKVKQELATVKETHEKERLKNEILDKLIEKHPFDVPDAMVNRYLGVILNRVIDGMKQGAYNPGDQGLSIEELKNKYREMAVRQVKEDVVLDTIAAKEKLEVSREETEKAVRSIAESRGVSFESLMGRIEKEGALEIIKDGMKHEKVFDIIIEASSAA